MIRHGWNVIAVCRICRVKTNVDLRVIAKVRGPEFSLWNRAARCRCVGCIGFVDFLARAPDGMTGHLPLTAPDPRERWPPVG